MKQRIHIIIAASVVALCACSSSEHDDGGHANLLADASVCDSSSGAACHGSGGALGAGGSGSGPIATGGSVGKGGTPSGMGGTPSGMGGTPSGMGGAFSGSGGGGSGGRASGTGGVANAAGGARGSGGGATGGGPCVADGTDNSCSRCIKAHCCTEWTACLEDSACSGNGASDGELACIQACLLEAESDPSTALEDCANACASGSLIAPSTNDLVTCIMDGTTACSLDCFGF